MKKRTYNKMASFDVPRNMPRNMPRQMNVEFSLPEIDAARGTPSLMEAQGTRSAHSRNRSNSSGSVYMQEDEDLSAYLERVVSQFGLALVPSYLQHAVGGEPPKAAKMHDIAALDGLRGWACLLVFNFHLLFTYTYHTHIGWGFAGQNFGLHQLPIFHMLISGHVMVAIFFVISGYVLSFRALKTIRSRNFDQTFTVLSSATFRRIFRLYIPSLVGLFCVFIAVRLHLFDYSRMIRDKGRVITGVNEQHPPHFRSTYKQFWDLWKTVGRLMNFWDWSLFYNNYNPHLWTIPVEFRSSIVLFVTLLATSRFTTKVRLGVEAVVLWFCIRYGRWDVVLFLSGLVLAEIDLINGIWSGPTLMPEKSVEAGALRQFYRRHEQTIWICLFVLGLYLGSSPNAGVNYTPGYVWLSRLIPKTYGEPHRFLQSIGAVLIVCSINNSKTIQKLFLNRLSQYVGQISYAFYIVHGPILHGLGYCIMSTVWKYVGRNSSIQFMAGVVVTWIICFSLSLWLADIFWRMVDMPSVRFARWLETKLLAKTGPLHSSA